jgi:hypothetical protein
MSAPRTFTKKDLRFTFTLSNNAVFAGTNSNVLKVAGLRATASLKGSGFPSFPTADISVYGLSQSDMIGLTALQFLPLNLQRNSVQVETNSSSGWSTVFAGQIITAGPDYANVPEVPLNVSAQILFFDQLNPATPTSYPGTASVAEVVSTIAAKMGRVFENNGVETQLSSPYFSGTLTDQLRAVAQHSGITVYTPPDENVVAICPRGVPRKKVETFVLTPASGLVGYPVLDYQRGIVRVRSIFNPAFRFGGPLTVQGSDVPSANGKWCIGTITHELSSLMPGGPWFSDMLLYPPGELPPSQ